MSLFGRIVFRPSLFNETIILFTTWLILYIFLSPVVEGKGRIEEVQGQGPSPFEERHISVKDKSKDVEEKDENFSFEQDEEVVKVIPELKLDDIGASPPLKPQMQMPPMGVGVELGFKPQKVKIAFAPEQQGQGQGQGQILHSEQSQWSQLQPVGNSALVSNRYEWGQSGYGMDENESNSLGTMDEKSMKSIADEVAENILQAADALYFSMNPAEGQASGWVAGQGRHSYQGGPGGVASSGNAVYRSKCRRNSLALFAIAIVAIILRTYEYR